MVDGIKIYYPVLNFLIWKELVNIEFSRTVLDSGAIKEKVRNDKGITKKVIIHRANFETYYLTVKEVTTIYRNDETIKYNLTIEGSLHKNHFIGANFSPFTWDDLQKEITHLENCLQLDLSKALIQNLEIGVNIPFPGPVFPFLQRNLISYKGETFNRYNPDKNGVCLGFVNMLSQYSVKVYDKGKQFDLPYELMRFELRFLKMQKLKKIKFLCDLRDRNKVNDFLKLLLVAWKNVLLYDNTINLKKNGLKQEDKEVLKNGGNPKYWERLKESDIRRFNYERDRFKKLVALHGTNEHKKIFDLIKLEWENLSVNCTNLPSGKTPNLSEFTIMIKGKNVQTTLPVPKIELTIQTKRVCSTCGRDISEQKGDSRFCGEKFVGEKEAHKCRNKESNKRNHLKHKIKTITERGVLFDITPYFKSYQILSK